MKIIGRGKKEGHRHLMLAAMITMALALTTLLVVQLAAPLRNDTDADFAVPAGVDMRGAFSGDPNTAVPIPSDAVLAAVRPGMFRSAAPLQDKPMADKTIERIRSQLTLQCILEMNHQPVAYIHVKDAGLKRCKIGDSVGDLFTVLEIRTKSVDLNILDHRVTLNL